LNSLGSGLQVLGARWPSASPDPSRSCRCRLQSSRPHRRHWSSQGCSSGTQSGLWTQLGHPPRAWPAGPLNQPVRPRQLAPGPGLAAHPLLPLAVAHEQLLLTSEAEIPPQSFPAIGHQNPRLTAWWASRGLHWLGLWPTSHCLERKRRESMGSTSVVYGRRPAPL
jgi:hypothetical protein